jgi:protein disulfide-isomerase
MRNYLIVGIAAAVCALAVQAQAGAGWETDFDKASAAAKKSGKYMLLDFSGSDWCGWCIKLDKEVFSQDAFKTYADKSLVPVVLDFPRKTEQSEELKKQNEALMKKYGIRGFPTVLVLSPEGELVGRTGYQKGGPEAYVKHLSEMIDKYKAGQKK